MVPDHLLDPVQAALIERLANTPIGNPRHPDTRMGAWCPVTTARCVGKGRPNRGRGRVRFWRRRHACGD